MSKNNPKQNVQALKEWLDYMKFKPKPKRQQVDAHNSIGEFVKRNK